MNKIVRFLSCGKQSKGREYNQHHDTCALEAKATLSSNPTALLMCAVDQDGVIYCISEYYQPGLGPSEHWSNLQQMPGLLDTKNIVADPSIFYQTQAQADGGFKSINDLYYRAGFKCLRPADNTAEESGMERILEHWHDLEHREPTLKIVCPARYDYSRKQFGLFRDGCPNLLWELMRTRREQLTARQSMSKNPSEGIVDKDNHVRDCLKYVLHLEPRPSEMPVTLKRDVMIAEAFRTGNYGSLAARIAHLNQQEQRQSEPISYRPRWPGNDGCRSY